jgi:hypothetical protein
MKEDGIIRIMKREAKNITLTGKAPIEGALPKWLHYMDHDLQFSFRSYLSASTKIGHRTRVFAVEYDIESRSFKSFIDTVPYN